MSGTMKRHYFKRNSTVLKINTYLHILSKEYMKLRCLYCLKLSWSLGV
jgi:hypothetical protein